MVNDAFISRILTKARSNQLAIVVGSTFSGELAIPVLAKKIVNEFNIKIEVANKYEYYRKWNELIDVVEKNEIFIPGEMKQRV